MDYIFASAVKNTRNSSILVSYDIACQWFINLYKHMEAHWPEDLRIAQTTTLTLAILKLHEPMHQTADHQVYSLNLIPSVGQSDCECPECVWSSHNMLGNSTKTQGPGLQQDILDDHFNFWNWQKYIGLGLTLTQKYKAAIAERNIQVEGNRGFTASLDEAMVTKWEEMCMQWELDPFPKSAKNPYQTDGIGTCFFLKKRNTLLTLRLCYV